MSRLTALGTALLLLVASVTCVFLGLWQWNRHQARSAQVDLIHANLHADPVPIEDLLGPGLVGPLDPDDVWHPVTVTGTWMPGSGVQLRNRPVADGNASHALAMLLTDAEQCLVVDRGWWRQTDVVPEGALEVPDGEASLVLRLRAAEAPDERTPPAGEVYRIVPEQVWEEAFPGASRACSLVTSAYGVLVDPPPTGTLGVLPDPDTSLRSHLSYAFQWWFFALAIPVAGVVLHRRGREAEQVGAADRTRPGVASLRRRPSLEDEEDAILDAQERRGAGSTEVPTGVPTGVPTETQASDTSSA